MPHGRLAVTICLSSCTLHPEYPGPPAYTPAIILNRGQPQEAANARVLLLPQAPNRMPESSFQLARSYVQVSAHVYLFEMNCSMLTSTRSQCAKRKLKCVYPSTSRRGIRPRVYDLSDEPYRRPSLPLSH